MSGDWVRRVGWTVRGHWGSREGLLVQLGEASRAGWRERGWLSLKSYCSMDMRYHRLEYDHKDLFDVYPVLPYEGTRQNLEQWLPMQQGLEALFPSSLIACTAIIGGKRPFNVLKRAINHALK